MEEKDENANIQLEACPDYDVCVFYVKNNSLKIYDWQHNALVPIELRDYTYSILPLRKRTIEQAYHRYVHPQCLLQLVRLW